jgi:N-methylhydantoinase B/oxoprolinase/acetone carboxylase alpha subunit
MYIRRGDEILPAQSHRMIQVKHGEIFGKVSGGGGGVGNPLEREPLAIQRDVRNGLTTVQYARDVYGVVLDPDTLEIDESATASLRAEMTAREVAAATEE